jgi:hypothetical protein
MDATHTQEGRAMQYDLYFTNPVFHSGLNMTVRDGDKWMKANVGDTVMLKETGRDHTIAPAKVMGKAHIPFNLIPESWLACEHDPACRNLGGLFAAMSRVYPGFSLHNYVTVLFFKI